MDRDHDRRHPHRLTPDSYAVPNCVVFVTVCSARHRAALTTPLFASVIVECMERGCTLHQVDLVAYCIMPNHVHCVLFTRVGCDVEKYVSGFKWATSRRLHAAGVVGDIWERSYWDRHHRDEDDVERVIEYVLDNPVRKGLCNSRDEWPHAAYLRHPGT